MNTILSIVIPCHNIEGKFNIIEGLYSIDNSSVEVVFVNDNSQDRTSYMLSEAVEALRVPAKVISGNFGGPGAARNAGIKESVGTYVWLLDADDVSQPRAVIEEVENMCLEKNDLIAFNFVRRSSEGGGAEDDKLIVPRIESGGLFERLTSLNRLFPLIISKELLVEHDLRFEEDVFMYEDALFMIKLLSKAKTFKHIDEVICIYLTNHNSLSQDKTNPRYLSMWTVIIDIVDYVRLNHPDEAHRFENHYVGPGLSEVWANYIHHGKYISLIRILPHLISIHTDNGLAHHFPKFVKKGSRSNRLLKTMALPVARLMSNFTGNGQEEIQKLYSR